MPTLAERVAKLEHLMVGAAPRPIVRRFVRWRFPLAHKYLAGLKGIEIGASAANDYFVDAINVDRYEAMDTVYKQEERRVTRRVRHVDLVAPGDNLPFKDNTVDFVLASHVIEHIPDPIQALKEWVRVARRWVFVVVPHRDRTFDRDRPVTPVSELVERHATRFTSEVDKHWSVWTCESFLELCDHLDLRVVDYQDPDTKMRNGFAVVIDAGAR